MSTLLGANADVVAMDAANTVNEEMAILTMLKYYIFCTKERSKTIDDGLVDLNLELCYGLCMIDYQLINKDTIMHVR